VLPESDEVDVEALVEEINRNLPDGVVLRQHKKEPFAYGLDSLMIALTMPDAAGYADRLERQVRDTRGVGEVTVETITRIL